MKRAFALSALFTMIFMCSGISFSQNSPFGNNPNFMRSDPSQYKPGKQAHGGAGSLDYMEITPRDEFKSNFIFLHRGIMNPKSGIGEHAHRKMEEMYFILDGYSEFTVSGRTSQIPSIGMVLCPMGTSHGIYNPTDKPVEWMNFGVSFDNRKYDAVNFNPNGDDLINQPLVSPPPFKWAVLDTRFLKPVQNFFGGKGTIYTREVWSNDSFAGSWEYVHHYLIPPGASIGLHRHDKMEVVYYILSGAGRGTISDATYDIRKGDAMSCTLHNSIGVYNNSKKNLEIIAVGVTLKKGDIDGIVMGNDLTGK